MWSIKYADTDYRFNHIAVSSVQIDGRTYRVDDTPNPRADGVSFGQDFADPGDVTIEILANFSTVRNVAMQRAMLLEAAESFISAWDAPEVRGVPGGVAELTIPVIGMMEGRPRRAEWDWSTLGLGYLKGTATFLRANHLVYTVDERGETPWYSARLNLVPSQVGGLKAPLAEPLRTSVESTRAAPITVEGRTPAWPVIELQGPIQSNAQVERAGAWRLYINRPLAYDQKATIDTRPGSRGTYINGRAANFLDPRSSMLSQAFLAPGQNVVALRGASLEGTAYVSFLWRESKARI